MPTFRPRLRQALVSAPLRPRLRPAPVPAPPRFEAAAVAHDRDAQSSRWRPGVLPMTALIFTSVFALALALAPASGARADDAAVLDRADANGIVASSDRTAADRRRDARRRPDELLEFARIGPGMIAADLGAGDGYTTELLARAVGESGRVYGQNSPYVVEKFVKETWPARLAKPVNANVVRVDAPISDPLPRTLDGVDVITMIFTYHDTYASMLGAFDHELFLRRLYKVLRPGGRIIVVDHRAAPGARGKEVADELHRIDEERVKEDFEQAGFVLDATADFMSNADDPRTLPFFDMPQPTDAFVHRWVKPKD